MEYVEPVYTVALLVALVGIIVALASSIAGMTLSDKIPGKVFQVTLVTLFTLGLATAISATIWAVTDRINGSSSLKDQVKDVYGLELSSNELQTLSYPSSEPKAGEVVEYGSIKDSFITESGELAHTKVTLAWVEHEFKLFESTDDEILGEELPRAKQ